MSNRPPRIVLTGFSGTGKSAVAPLVAHRLGWEVLDTDHLVEERTGRPIPDIFRDEGEERFRQLETEALREACWREDAVVSAGGGAVLRRENRARMADGGFIVCLEARPETILRRLQAGQAAEPLDRPLLTSADPLARIRGLKAARQQVYALCDWTVHTDGLTADEVADEVVRAYKLLAAPVLADAGRVPGLSAAGTGAGAATSSMPEGAACIVRTAGGAYPVFVGWGALGALGRRLRDAGLARQVYVITDDAVFHHLGARVEGTLKGSGIPFDSRAVKPGEASKSLETAAGLYDWLVGRQAERGHAVAAVGGGVVTDLGGFVAATFARGLPLVHVPTTLLGMVDAAIGGKVAVNHPRAKNMIGCFYQPRLVLADVSTLSTLPPRELRSGWGEVIKHAFIADEGYLEFLEENAEAIQRLDPETTAEAIRRSVVIKADVVGQDEREETGLRMVLNYGHTLAHAIEAATDYGRYLHGEAVAAGMTAAAEISVHMGLLTPEAAARQLRLLKRFGLPVSAGGLDRQRIAGAMALDKKVRGKAVRWVLLEGIGRPAVRDDVPPEVVEAALDTVLG